MNAHVHDHHAQAGAIDGMSAGATISYHVRPRRDGDGWEVLPSTHRRALLHAGSAAAGVAQARIELAGRPGRVLVLNRVGKVVSEHSC